MKGEGNKKGENDSERVNRRHDEATRVSVRRCIMHIPGVEGTACRCGFNRWMQQLAESALLACRNPEFFSGGRLIAGQLH